MIHLTAAHWQHPVGEWHRAGVNPPAALEGVRLVNVTGDALSPHKLEQWDAIRPAHKRLINTYGPTEITISCSAAYVRHAPGMSRVSIGRPFANSRTYLLDARGEPVPVGVTGELYIGGDGVARGYPNRPGVERGALCRRSVPPRLADVQDGRPRSPARRKTRSSSSIATISQVKVRGFRVELSEVETRLAAVDGAQENGMPGPARTRQARSGSSPTTPVRPRWPRCANARRATCPPT